MSLVAELEPKLSVKWLSSNQSIPIQVFKIYLPDGSSKTQMYYKFLLNMELHGSELIMIIWKSYANNLIYSTSPNITKGLHYMDLSLDLLFHLNIYIHNKLVK